MKVVPKEQIEKWCSDECAERAMYIRVQLVEQPAWERGAVGRGQAEQILLLEEGRARRQRNRMKARENEMERKEVVQEEQVKEANDVEEAMRRLVISDKSLEPEAIVDGMGQLAVRDDDGVAGQATLAMERGDRDPHPGLDVGRVGVNIFEKQNAGMVQAPSLRVKDLHGGSIEGFEPSRQLGKARRDAMGDDDNEEDDDILPTI